MNLTGTCCYVVLLRCRVAGVAIALFDSSFGGGVVPEGFWSGSPYDSGMIRNSGSDSELWFASLCRVAIAQKHRGQRGPATLVLEPKANATGSAHQKADSKQSAKVVNLGSVLGVCFWVYDSGV